MLRINDLVVKYGEVLAINRVSITVKKGTITALLGSNGTGKTTLLRAISGIIKPAEGNIYLDSKRIDILPPHQIANEGVAHVPEGRQIFYDMSVLENLLLGAYSKPSKEFRQKKLNEVFEFFPRLVERKNQKAGTLSGGEQQMLAIGRALMNEPKLIIFDEPSLGLAPNLVQQVFEIIKKIREKAVTILLVEQNVNETLKFIDYGYVLQTGEIVLEGTREQLKESDLVKKAFLGL